MIYTYNREITEPGFECSKSIVLYGQAHNGDKLETYVTRDILCNSSIFNLFKMEGDKLMVAVLPDLQVPVLIGEGGQDCTPIYTAIRGFFEANGVDTLPDHISRGIVQSLVQSGFDATTAAIIVASCMVQLQYEAETSFSSVINIGPDSFDPAFFNLTLNVIGKSNTEKVTIFSGITASENATKKQNECTDPLFIKIPDRSELQDEFISTLSTIPKRNEVVEPYGVDELPNMILYNGPNSVFPRYKYPLVEGVSANNAVGILENEALYHTCLMEWVQANMRDAFNNDVDVSVSNPNIDAVSQEYLTELVNAIYSWHWGHNPNIPEINEDYDEDSDSSIVSKYVFRPTVDEQALLRSGVTDLSASRSYHVNALEILDGFLRDASLVIGYKAYLDAIVKLARWGERKCTALQLEGYPLVFHLGNNTVKTYMGTITDYQIEPVNGFEGEAVCAIYDSSIINDKAYLEKHSYKFNRLLAPIGLYTKKTLKNKEAQGPEKIEVATYYPMLDLVKLALSGDLSLDGIGADLSAGNGVLCDEAVTVSKLLYESENSKEESLSDPFYRSTVLQDLYIDLKASVGTDRVRPNQFNILQGRFRSTNLEGDYSRLSFKSKEDLQDKRMSRAILTPGEAIGVCVSSVILPIYVEVSARYAKLKESGEVSLTTILGLYKDVMLEMNYVDEASFMETYTRSVESKGVRELCGGYEPKVQAMNLFGGVTASEAPVVETPVQVVPSVAEVVAPVMEVVAPAKQESVQEVVAPVTVPPVMETVTKKFSICKDVAPDSKFFLLTDAVDVPIGGCSVEEVVLLVNGEKKSYNKYTFVDRRYMDTVNPSKIQKTFKLSAVVPLMLNDLYFMERELYDHVNAFFLDLPTVKYYRDLIQAKLVDKTL